MAKSKKSSAKVSKKSTRELLHPKGAAKKAVASKGSTKAVATKSAAKAPAKRRSRSSSRPRASRAPPTEECSLF